jgi:hypothetical protein
MTDKKREPVVGEVVHYVNRREVHHAALITHSYIYDSKRVVDLYVIANVSWRKPRHKMSVSYSKKPLNRTWHYLTDERKKAK